MRNVLSAAVRLQLWNDTGRLFGAGLGASALLCLLALLWSLPVPPARPLLRAATVYGQELARIRRPLARYVPRPVVIAGGCDSMREVCALRPRPTDEAPRKRGTMIALPE